MIINPFVFSLAGPSASVSFVAASGTNYIATGTSINAPSTPAGIANSDGLYAVVFARSVLTPPAGWALIASKSNVGASTQTVYVYRKTTVASGDSSTAFVWGQAASGRMGLGYVVVRSSLGAITEAEIGTAETDYATSTAYPQNVTVPILTSTENGELFLITATCEAAAAAFPWTAAAGATLRTTATQDDNRLVAATQTRTTGESNSSPMTVGTGGPGTNYHSAIVVRLQADDVTWNPLDKSSRVTLSGANKVARKTSGTTSTWDMARATLGRSSGKYYFEVRCVRISGTDSNIMIGIANATAALDTASGFPGGNVNGYGVYLLNGNKYTNGADGGAYSSAWDGDTVIGVAVNFDTGKIWIANENVYGSSGNPAAGTGEAFSGIVGTFYPAASMLNVNVFDCTGRFKTADFTYAPPSGFSPWQS